MLYLNFYTYFRFINLLCLGNIGFLAEDRRMNVALTRARRHLFVVGDSQTVSHHPFLNSMCKYLQTEGDLRSPENAASFAFVSDVSASAASTQAFELPESFQNKSSKQTNQKTGDDKKKVKEDSKDDGTVLKDPTTASVSSERFKDMPGKGKYSKPISASTPPKPKPVPTEVIRNQIDEFSKNSESELVFPCTLSAKERAFVHEVSEQFGLNHISCGEGNKRRIVVSKMDSSAKTGEFLLSAVMLSLILGVLWSLGTLTSKFVEISIKNGKTRFDGFLYNVRNSFDVKCISQNKNN